MTEYKLKEGRSYVHDDCGNATLVTGTDYPELCNPFHLCLGTMCASCGVSAGTQKFKWADTGESLSDYRKRLHREASVFLKAFHYVIGPLSAAGLFGYCAYAFGGGVPGGIIGTLGGIAFMLLMFGPMIADAFGSFWKKQ